MEFLREEVASIVAGGAVMKAPHIPRCVHAQGEETGPEGSLMLKPFTTERLAIRQLQIRDAPELARISDIPAVSQWMAFMEGGFPLEKAQALIASQSDTKEYFFAVRLPDGTLIGAMGVIDHPDGTIEVGYWFGIDYQCRGQRKRSSQ
jgi:RimJ/RimL family protein N-acetyltransferase